MNQFTPNMGQSMGQPPQGFNQVQMPRQNTRPGPGPKPKPPAKPSAFDSFSWVTVVLLAFVAVVGFLWKYGYLIGGPR